MLNSYVDVVTPQSSEVWPLSLKIWPPLARLCRYQRDARTPIRCLRHRLRKGWETSAGNDSRYSYIYVFDDSNKSCWRFSFVVGAAIYIRWLQQQTKILSRSEWQCEVVGELNHTVDLNEATVIQPLWDVGRDGGTLTFVHIDKNLHQLLTADDSRFDP